MKNRRLLLSVALVVALGLAIVVPASAGGEPPCGGCTPGYWKNHTESWEGFTTGQYFDVVFGCGPRMTLLEALSAKNKDVGSGVEAALVRHAVAALLSAAHPDMTFGTVEGIQTNVCAAWNSGDKSELERYKNWLDGQLNQLPCLID